MDNMGETQDTLEIALEIAPLINDCCETTTEVAAVLEVLVDVLKVKFSDLSLTV